MLCARVLWWVGVGGQRAGGCGLRAVGCWLLAVGWLGWPWALRRVGSEGRRCGDVTTLPAGAAPCSQALPDGDGDGFAGDVPLASRMRGHAPF